MTDLESILSRLGLSQYLDQFVAEGFESWETVLDITEADLVALHVKRGHRRILQREIASARGFAVDQGLHTPTRSTPTDDGNVAAEERASSPKAEHGKAGPGQGGKRKYRRHPKADENAPDRPPSAYVIFSNKTREDLRGQNLSFTEIAKVVGERWQILSPEGKEPYETQAALAKLKYNAEFSEYKKTDACRDYTQYLADFKAKYSAQQSAEGKRARTDAHAASVSSGGVDGGISAPGPGGGANASPRTSGHARATANSTGSIASSGQRSPPLASTASTPVAAHAHAGAAQGVLGPAGMGHSRRHGSPPLQSPTTSSGYIDHPMNSPPAASVRLALSEDRRDFRHLPGAEHLPRIVPVGDPTGHRPGRTSLPPLNLGGLAPREDELPKLAGRRSARLPTTLTRDGTAVSSTSSESTRTSGTSNGSVIQPPTPTDGLPYQRGLPMPQTHPVKMEGVQPYSSFSRLMHPPVSAPLTVSTGVGLCTHAANHASSTSNYVQAPPSGSGVLSFGPTYSEGTEVANDHDQARDLSRGDHGPPAGMGKDGNDRSSTSPMSDVRATSAISVLLMAGERIAARDAGSPS
ncbi:MAG: hypothetical protein M1832_003239 [Thelocarpon impressellum]|nr:MAG: hypothetical protein M1832_003239 [Thelocarpon impressellum]